MPHIDAPLRFHKATAGRSWSRQAPPKNAGRSSNPDKMRRRLPISPRKTGSVPAGQNRRLREMDWAKQAQPLVQQALPRHKREMSATPPQIFDSKRRLGLRGRALARGLNQSFLMQHMADELADRLSFITRDFENMLLLGPIAEMTDRLFPKGVRALTCAPMIDEEMLPYPPASFDLIISAGTLDSANDLPGVLVQARRALKPDGLFLGTLFGAGSLVSLKSALLLADAGRTTAHVHPQIDLRSISDLVMRAGFALPVCDLDSLSIRYASWRRLVADLRDAGAGNALAGPRPFAGRDMLARLDAIWENMAAADGRVTETFNFLQISGWAPAESQPKPARRGSGQVSLAELFPLPKRSE
jgi:NADH dehydrogenase [ubiquinone] 1 alpha subcomplex assembly factor 5